MKKALDLSGFNITGVQVYILQEPQGKTVALARIVLNDAFQLTSLRIVNGIQSLFVVYPNDPSYKGDDYRSLFYPVTNDLRTHIENVIIAKYNEELARASA